jgi:hypothetical protein
MENKSRAKIEETVDEAFGYFRVFGHNTAGLSDRKTPKPSAIRQRPGVPITLYLFGGIQDDISVLPDQALSH